MPSWLNLVAVLLILCGSGYQQKPDIETLTAKAKAGDAEAQHNLGYAYITGEGVPKDYAEAVKWYRKAAELGLASGQPNLGAVYFMGNGVQKNDVEVVKWYRKAAELGLASGQPNLGAVYFMGNGVQKDYVEAYKWLNLAAVQGVEEAKKNNRLIADKMTKEQIAEAQKLAFEFKPSPSPASNWHY